MPLDALPETYDAEQQTPLPVYAQGAVPACVGMTLAALKTMQEEIEVHDTLPFSGLDLYQLIKKPSGGAVIRDGLDYLKRVGAPLNGQNYPISAYAGVVPSDHNEVKNSLYTTKCLAVGISVPASFKAGGGEEFGGPTKGDQIVGNHALLAVGWTPIGPILHNSWGPQWGENGRRVVSWQWWDAHVLEAWAAIDATNPT